MYGNTRTSTERSPATGKGAGWLLRHATLLGLIGGAIAVMVSGSTAGVPASGEQWSYGTGTQHYEYGDQHGSLHRTVEAWVASDGRYRVVVVSDDGAAEEFTFDGVDARMFITPPGQKKPSSIVTLKSPTIFAVEGFDGFEFPITGNEADKRLTDGRTNLPTHVYKTGIRGASYELNMKWIAIDPDSSLLAPSAQAAEIQLGQPTPAEPSMSTKHVPPGE